MLIVEFKMCLPDHMVVSLKSETFLLSPVPLH